MKVVLYRSVGPSRSARSRRTGIRSQVWRVKQAIAGRLAEGGIKRCRVEYRQLVIRLVGPGQIGIANAKVQSQAVGYLPVVIEINLKVLPAALLFENDVLFAPTDPHIPQKKIGR